MVDHDVVSPLLLGGHRHARLIVEAAGNRAEPNVVTAIGEVLPLCVNVAATPSRGRR